MMTAEKATEVSDGSGTGLFDVEKRQWNFSLIDKLGFSRDIFPKCCESDDIAGHITADAAEATGLPVGMPVYAGGVITSYSIHYTKLYEASECACQLSGYADNCGRNG